MVIYNPKDWLKLIFQFHRSDTFRMLIPGMIGVGIYCFIVVYIEIEIYALEYKSTPLLHSILGFVISMLLVFRTNTAYERWWEGRKIWGALVNCSRNFALKIDAMIPDNQFVVKNYVRVVVGNFVTALKEHLRDGTKLEELEETTNQPLSKSGHVPNQLIGSLMKEINKAYKTGVISGDQLIVLNNELTAFTDITGACERIKKTPIPYSYSLFIKKFIFIYVMTMPFGFVNDFRYWTVLVVVFTFYVLVSLELIAEEIEDPFGKDANDLPTDDIVATIKRNLDEILPNK